MYTIKYKSKEIPEKISKRNVIIIITWFFITLLVFLLSLFTTYLLLPIFLLFLLSIIPLTLLIKHISKKNEKEIIRELELDIKDRKLFNSNLEYHVYYDEIEDKVYLFNTSLHIKYKVYIKTREINIMDEQKDNFLEFCNFHHIDIKDKNYIL